MSTAKVIALSYLFLLSILTAMTLFSLSMPYVFGQVAKAPNISANPATITSNGVNTESLKLQEQKGWLLVEPPPGYNQPSAQSFGGSTGEIMGYVATAMAAFNVWRSKQQGDVQKAQGNVQKEQGAVQVQQAVVQKESLKLQYDTMGKEKADAINNREEIKLKNVAELEQKAINANAKS